MVTAIRLSDFSTAPLYNIKAVVQVVAISPSTLRAWERRYHMCQPQRSESGYRLYSDRDIAVIRWLKVQVDAGMSISHAVAWLQSLTTGADDGVVAALPDPTGRLAAASTAAQFSRLEPQNYGALQQQLIAGLLEYDEAQAEQVLSSAFALYPIEQVGEHVIMPTLVELGERWHRGAVSITREHYATNYLLQRLAALLRSTPSWGDGPTIWVGCAPGERHEIGTLLLTIYLRRHSYQVCYLGQDLLEDDLIQEISEQKPALVLFSATSTETAANLRQLCSRLVELGSPCPLIGYGGRVFNLHPELRTSIAGVFLGATATDAVLGVGELLAVRQRQHS